MNIKFLVIFILFDNIPERINGVLTMINPKDVVSVLSHRYHDFRHVAEELIQQQMNMIAKIKSNLITGFKSYSVVEPSDKETLEADEALANSYAIGCETLPDSNQTINEFCAKRKERSVIIKNWVTRKYTFNLIVRLVVNLVRKKIDRKDDIYCSSFAYKQYYVTNAIQLKNINSVLSAIKDQFVNNLIAVQNTNLGIGKVRTFCCSYWNYRNETLNAIPSIENQLFVKDMIDGYYGLAINYFCFYNTEKWCRGPLFSPKVSNPYSLGMQLIRAVAKISSIVL